MLSLETPRPTSSPIPPSGGRPLDWSILQRQADALYRAQSDNNEFGLDNRRWDRDFRQEMPRQKNTRSDEEFLRTLRENQEWIDLELLLRVLTEFGARPLLLSMPIHGGWYDQCGVTYTARWAYYREAARDRCPLSRGGRQLRRSRCRSVLLLRLQGAPEPRRVGALRPGLRRFLPRHDPAQPELPAARERAAERAGTAGTNPEPIARMRNP